MIETTIANQLRQGRLVAIRPQGRSMRPLLYGGKATVIVAPLKEIPTVGDLLLYLRTTDNQYILHRLIGIEKDTYCLQGDNRLEQEECPKDRVIGKVVVIYRNGKEVPLDSWLYKLYTWFWCHTPFARKLYKKIHSIKRSINRALESNY